MQVIQCQICQVTNDESAQFCRECGGRLQSAAPLQPSASIGHVESEPQEVVAHIDPPKRQRLHSPILGGGGGGNDDDDDPPAPSFQRVKSGQGNPGGSGSNPSLSQGRRGLRSPLLGGDGDEMDEPNVAPRGKSGFGGFGGGGKQKKTEFPHRHHDAEENHEQGQNPNAGPNSGSGSGAGTGPNSSGGQKSTGARGLRSPLLGGGAGDGDYAGGYENDNPRASGKQSKPGRLRSPILGGGGGGDDYYEDEIFDDEVEEINDPTVLRSPLLAVRTPKHSNAGASMQGTPAMANQNIPVGGPKAAPFVQGPYTQASAGNAPNFAASSPPMPQAQPQQMQGQQGQQSDPVNAQGGPNFAAFPPNQGNQIGIIPQAPNQAPAYTPPPAPPAPAPAMPPASPEQYSYGVASPAGQNPNLSAQNMTPPNYQAPMPKAPTPQQTGSNISNMPRPNQQALPSLDRPANLSSNSTGTGMEPALATDEAAPKARGMRGSKLLGDVSDDPIGPLDRRARFADRRGTSRGTGHGMSAVDDDDDDQSFSKGNRGSNNYGAAGGGGANAMAPVLMALAVVALIAKGYYMSTYMGNPNLFTTALPATIDQLTSMLVLVGIILFAMKAAQKS